jgi:hypothetical protein
MRRDPRSAASRITYLELGVVYDLGLVGGDPDRAVEERRRRWPHLSVRLWEVEEQGIFL